MSHVARKPVFGVSEQVRHKQEPGSSFSARASCQFVAKDLAPDAGKLPAEGLPRNSVVKYSISPFTMDVKQQIKQTNQRPVVQSIVSLTASQDVNLLSIRQLYYQIHCYLLLEKFENLLQCKRFSHFSNKK